MASPPIFTPDVLQLLSELPRLPHLVIRHSLAGYSVEALEPLIAGTHVSVVSDAKTRAVLADRVCSELSSRYTVANYILPGEPRADEQTVGLLTEATKHADALIAVGSGTISDLCKYSSFKQGKPYATFPTAPSMNGYTSANASITMRGHKQTLAAHLPVAVLCDVGVLSKAPARLIRAGVGDSLARSTAQADWLMSHLLIDTPYDDRPFRLTAPYEKELLASIDALASGDNQAHTLLIKLLLLSGFGMTLAGGSYPASQGEHMIAHAYETLEEREAQGGEVAVDIRVFHGEAIGVTTLYMAKLQEALLASHPLLKKGAGDKIRAVMLRAEDIESALKRMGAPTTPQELGWDEQMFEKAVELAPTLRDRYTFLDLQS